MDDTQVGQIASWVGLGKQDHHATVISAVGEPRTVDIPQTVTAVAPGTTPMAQRVAVLGLLNKRNGIVRDLTLKPNPIRCVVKHFPKEVG